MFLPVPPVYIQTNKEKTQQSRGTISQAVYVVSVKSSNKARAAVLTHNHYTWRGCGYLWAWFIINVLDLAVNHHQQRH